MTDEQVKMLANAIRTIASGDASPNGLEFLAMAFSRNDVTVTDGLFAIAEALDNIAESIKSIK